MGEITPPPRFPINCNLIGVYNSKVNTHRDACKWNYMELVEIITISIYIIYPVIKDAISMYAHNSKKSISEMNRNIIAKHN